MDLAIASPLDQPIVASEAIAPQILRALRLAIVTLRFTPGQALSETEIAKIFGVSRQPVREAFIKLAEAGLVVIRPQRGTFVVKIALRDVLNARFVREAVEVAVVGQAAESGGADLVGRLERLVAEQRRIAQEGDWAAFLGLDEAFHRAIAEGVGCGFAWRVVESVKAQMDRVRYLSFSGVSPLPLLIEQHAAILAAIADHDRAAAEAAMRTHLREILNAVPALARVHPDYFEGDQMPDVLAPKGSASTPLVAQGAPATMRDAPSKRGQSIKTSGRQRGRQGGPTL